MSSNIIFRKHLETEGGARISVWAFERDSVHLEVESKGVLLSSVLRITREQARSIGDALIAAANVVEVPA